MTRIHVVSLPHTQLTRDYDWCAYTAKVRRFADMLTAAGVEAVVYGPAEHELTIPSENYAPIVFASDRQEWFGTPEWDTSQVFGYWDPAHPSWTEMNTRAAFEIRQRWQPGDILGIIAGLCQKQIVDDLADLKPLVTEWGIGYSGVLPGSHRVFESYAWMHHVAGFYRDDEMRFYDAVIPNCFDPEDFDFGKSAGDYLLYMGRPNPRKGLPIIADIAQRVDMPVLIAGQPGPEIPGTTYVGLVVGQTKKTLLAGARALLTPTTYLEPFGGVAVEAMMSGTPVIATDYGAFTETVVPGLTGYRCRTLSDFLDAVEAVGDLDRTAIHEHAHARWSTQTGSRLYGTYLQRLTSLYGAGWYHDTAAAR